MARERGEKGVRDVVIEERERERGEKQVEE